MPKVNENKVVVRKCPHCGMPRPEDWFAAAGGRCWKCRALRPEEPPAAPAAPGTSAGEELLG